MSDRHQDRKRPSKSRRPRRRSTPKPPPYKRVVHVPKRYGVIFFASLSEARAKIEEIKVKAQDVDQLNIVIREEADMDDPSLTPYGKVFAGEAWALIHDRRVEEGWYDKPQ